MANREPANFVLTCSDWDQATVRGFGRFPRSPGKLRKVYVHLHYFIILPTKPTSTIWICIGRSDPLVALGHVKKRVGGTISLSTLLSRRPRLLLPVFIRPSCMSFGFFLQTTQLPSCLYPIVIVLQPPFLTFTLPRSFKLSLQCTLLASA